MASCQPCGPLPTNHQSRSNISCPPCPCPCPPTSCPPCPCPPSPCAPCPCPPSCTIPVMADHVPRYQINPCDPNRPSGENNCCCNVCVPVMQPAPKPEIKKPKKKCKYIQPPRPKSYAPSRKFMPPEMKMEDGTIYRKSYIPVETDKPEKIIPEDNLCVGEGKISDNTVNKMSYQPHKVKPACPIYPCEHKLLGEGPMQDITTQKHDFVPKPYVKPISFKPFTNLYSSDCPLVTTLTDFPICQ
ncbi:hypothetical protein JTB14_000221 [Gonioctena quinquepunctata]|nr:hypothetical protein JTB14_000221 [Gonioctena quinquepunctata]